MGGPSFDPTALSWCLAEIRTALVQAAGAVEQASGAADGRTAHFHTAATRLRQAHGALRLLEVGGATALTGAAGELLERVERGEVPLDDEFVRRLSRACAALVEYLESVVAGAADSPVSLFPQYRDLLATGAAERIEPSDLYPVDLRVCPPRSASHEPLDAAASARVRAEFERGLLAFLRNPSDLGALGAMHGAIDRLHRAHASSDDHVFWWLAAAFFDALRVQALPVDLHAKRLVARVNLQIRRTLQQGDPIAQRMPADLLFALARAGAGSVPADAARGLYGLEGTVPTDFETPRYGLVDARTLQAARDAVALAETGWERYVRGAAQDLPGFASAAAQLETAVARLPWAGLHRLAGVMNGLRRVLVAAGPSLAEVLSLEVATALLFVDQALERGARGIAQHDRRAVEMAERIERLCDRQVTDGAPMPEWLVALSRAAQDRLTIAAFAIELNANLETCEQVLDGFFRDPAQRDGLPDLEPLMRQVAGALRLLGHDDAAAGADEVAQRVAAFVQSDAPAPQGACERVACCMGALGFFVASLQQAERWRGGFTFVLEDGVFVARLGAAPDPHRDPAAAPDAEVASVPETEPVSVPPVDASDAPAAPAAPAPPAAPAAVEPVASHAAAPEAGLLLDAELLEIFLDEASEVLQEIEVGRIRSQASPADPEPLASLRRGFHTLKGSSRMVGLAGFGDAAWSVEDVLNAWLAGGRAATGALHAALVDAHREMSGWLAALRADPDARIEPSALVARVRALEPGVGPVPGGRAAAAAGPARAMPTEWVELAGQDGTDGPDGLGTVDAPDGVEQDGSPAVVPPALIDLADLDLDLDLDLEVSAPVGTPGRDPSAAIDGPNAIDEVIELGASDAMPDRPEWQASERTPLEDPEPGRAGDAPVVVRSASADPMVAGPDVAAAGAAGTHAGSPAAEVRIGDRVLNAQLYGIFVAEADQLLAELDASHARWRAAPAVTASEPALRAAHSLAGISALVGLDALHAAADALERFMLSHATSGRALEDVDLDDQAFVLERMRAGLQAFAAGFDAADDLAMLARAEMLAERWGELGTAAPLELFVEDEPDAAARGSGPGVDAAGRTSPADDPSDASVPVPDRAEPTPVAALEVTARAAGPAAPADETLDGDAALVDEIDPELAQVFIEEAEDLLPRIGDALRAWAERPSDGSQPQSLMRLLHTVKGSARMAGAMRLGQLVHEMETRIGSASTLPGVAAALVDELVARHDQVLVLFEVVRDPRSATARADVRAIDAAQAAGVAPPHAPRLPDGAVADGAPMADSAMPAASGPVSAAQPSIRVRADLLDRLVNQAGEVSIARARLDNELGLLRQSLSELSENVTRLRSQLREIELAADTQIQARSARSREADAHFDPLEFDRYTRFQELTRMLAESVSDVATVQHNALRSLDEANRDLARQNQVTRDLQQDLMRIRMVRFGSIADRLYRVVRQAAKELDKRVNLDLQGVGAELDRGVLERMAGPIEHLLRNAVAHGIESRTERTHAGKSETGEITVEVRQEGNEVILRVADDGAGLDLARIRSRAIERGLLDAAARTGERELGQMIFLPGFSTASEVTALAGRGVGMDVVRAEVAAMGGRIDLDSAPGHGTRFTVHLPVSLAVTQVVLLTVGTMRVAVAAALVEQVLQLKPEALAATYDRHSVEWQGEPVPLYFLGSMLELSGCTPLAQRYSPVVVLRSGNARIALHVDHVSPSQEVVVKNVGPQLARLTGMAGATVLGNGEIVLILNPVQIAATGRGHQAGEGDTAGFAPTRIEIEPTVMVVDDSVTVRKVTQRLLLREGYQVLLAKDGVDALRLLQDNVPDVMLLDIEMPRMDGFDLTRNLRGDERWRGIPIVMISSRTADKHREHAMSLGVDVFLGKPYDEAELLRQVRELAARRQPAG